MSTIIKADADGAVALPVALCREAGVLPGVDVVAEVLDGRIVLSPTVRSLAERIATLANALPRETLDLLPTDGASQHDHYIYGKPKRTE